jgi:hypothetical protein
MLGMMTGNDALSGAGKQITSNVAAQAELLQDSRQKDEQRRVMQKYYDAQTSNWEASQQLEREKYDRGIVEADRLHDRGILEADRLHDEGEFKDRPANQEVVHTKLLEKGREKLLATGQNYDAVARAINQLDQFEADGESPGSMEFMGMPMPWARTGANYLASINIGTDSTIRAQAYWQDFDRLYTLAMRNSMFGATLTNNEQKAWAAANPSKEMNMQQLQRGMRVLRRVLAREIGNRQRSREAGKYNMEEVNALVGNRDFSGIPLDSDTKEGQEAIDFYLENGANRSAEMSEIDDLNRQEVGRGEREGINPRTGNHIVME